MTKVSEIYDAILASTVATLPTYTQMANPYVVEENPNMLFDKSFGLAFAPGVNTNRLAKPKLSRALDFDVILINKINFTETNSAAANAQQKDMQEDLLLLQKAYCNDGTINDKASKFEYVADNGIEYISNEKLKFYLLQAQFTFEYFDDL